MEKDGDVRCLRVTGDQFYRIAARFTYVNDFGNKCVAVGMPEELSARFETLPKSVEKTDCTVKIKDDYWKYIDKTRCDQCKHDNNLESWKNICPKCEHDYTDEDGNVYLVHDMWEHVDVKRYD